MPGNSSLFTSLHEYRAKNLLFKPSVMQTYDLNNGLLVISHAIYDLK